MIFVIFLKVVIYQFMSHVIIKKKIRKNYILLKQTIYKS